MCGWVLWFVVGLCRVLLSHWCWFECMLSQCRDRSELVLLHFSFLSFAGSMKSLHEIWLGWWCDYDWYLFLLLRASCNMWIILSFCFVCVRAGVCLWLASDDVMEWMLFLMHMDIVIYYVSEMTGSGCLWWLSFLSLCMLKDLNSIWVVSMIYMLYLISMVRHVKS